jgi:hypothetical protein
MIGNKMEVKALERITENITKASWLLQSEQTEMEGREKINEALLLLLFYKKAMDAWLENRGVMQCKKIT